MSRKNITAMWGEGLETIDGVTKTRAQWCKDNDIPLRLARQRVTYGKWSIARAVTEPMKYQRRTSHGAKASPAVNEQTERMKRYFEREYGYYGKKRR